MPKTRENYFLNIRLFSAVKVCYEKLRIRFDIRQTEWAKRLHQRHSQSVIIKFKCFLFVLEATVPVLTRYAKSLQTYHHRPVRLTTSTPEKSMPVLSITCEGSRIMVGILNSLPINISN